MTAPKPKIFLFLILLTFISCSDSLDYVQKLFQRQMQDLGYIPYKTPLHHGGTGTLIGGTPDSLNIIANPQTCFPDKIEGQPSNLRFRDYSVLPDRKQTIQVSGSESLHLLKSLNIGNPNFSANMALKTATSMEVAFHGVNIEYMDSIALADFYRQHMSPICKEYLERVGFIVQAIRVDEMRLKFYDTYSRLLKLDLGQIKQALDTTTEVNWQIKNESMLIIDAPQYIGYQLGTLRKNGNGLSLYRATKQIKGQFAFNTIDIFDSHDTDSNKNLAILLDNDPSQFYRNLESVVPIDYRFQYPLAIKRHQE